ncbi:ATP-binding protein [Candidatus Methanodesulfokora washburnensis]|uniref:ATP-binding protein n=1 Tax=Candidatus Methanodesulfokora washburnensis TaxID=2478471 RepID=A0A429GNT6_9CREN|nr:ATP-binding protein [Candidatus Methanodesulfokores washburnensis]RSN75431.1 ATP-binding protein [Candidatus Methanodesulfokores washburnensis]
MTPSNEISFIKEFSIKRSANVTNVYFFETQDFKRIQQFLSFLTDQSLTQDIFRYSPPAIMVWDLQTNEIYDPITKSPVQLDGASPFGINPVSLLPRLRSKGQTTVLIIKYVYLQSQANMLSDFLLAASHDDGIYENKSTVVVFCADAELFPQVLRNLCYTITIISSTPEERRAVLESLKKGILEELKRRKIADLPITLNDDIINASGGLNLHEVSTAALESFKKHKNFMVQEFTNYKIKLLKEAGLEYIEPRRGFESVGGYDYLKQYVSKRIITVLRKPEIAKHYGIPIPKGILLFGPPGTGKTWFAKAMAKEVGLPMIIIDPSVFLRGIVGETEMRVKRVTQLIESLAPCMVFIDEFDQLTLSRASVMSTDSGVSRRMTNMLLTWLGDENRKAFVVGATNFLSDIDPAFLRPGRLDDALPVFYPDVNARLEILKVHTSVIRKMPIDNSVDLTKIAQMTEYFTGAELEKVVIEAAITAMDESSDHIKQDHFDKAIKSININPEEREKKLRAMIFELKKFENINQSLIEQAMRMVTSRPEESRVAGVI